MTSSILIVEDELIVARDLQLILQKAGYQVSGIARSVKKAQELVRQEKPALVLLDICLAGKETGIDLAHQLREQHIAFIYLSANSSPGVLAAAKTTQPYGFLVKPFRARDVLVTIEIALYLHRQHITNRLQQAAALQTLIHRQQTDNSNLSETLQELSAALQSLLHFDMMLSHNATGTLTGTLRTGFQHYQLLDAQVLARLSGVPDEQLNSLLVADPVQMTPTTCDQRDIRQNGLLQLLSDNFEWQSVLRIPLPCGEQHCMLSFFSRKAGAYHTEHLNLLQDIVQELGILLSAKYHQSPAGPGSWLAANTGTSCFDQIIGKHHLLLQAFDDVKQVAELDTSVLITGESGTGKERIADCIHRLSPRRDKPFIKVNCAALPESLINSELFGHEKGAFTGATERRIGKFEQAHEGTLFLDEIGEMPLELQSRLLRVLQEREIERLGGKAPIKVAVRVVAATNRNLEQEVAAGRFRLDLYYRLHIFPIQLPALRDRKEDIPALVEHFVTQFSHRFGRAMPQIQPKVLKDLMAYHWPGNVRELEHVIERSVIMVRDGVMKEAYIK